MLRRLHPQIEDHGRDQGLEVHTGNLVGAVDCMPSRGEGATYNLHVADHHEDYLMIGLGNA